MSNASTKVVTFIGIVITFMMIPPFVNWLEHTDTSPFQFDQATLYNTDFIVKPLQRAVFDYGIRLSPKKVVIGKNEWLFLGDKFANNVTRRIQGVSQQDLEWIRSTVQRLKLWRERFRANGVKEFRVLVGPDKATIYPQNLPDWARPALPTRTDSLFDALADNGLDMVVDPRETLTRARKEHPESLYLRTDTHWNDLGAWIALDHFAQASQTDRVDFVTWPDRTSFEFQSEPSTGGDLSLLLKIELTDISLKASFKQPIDTATEALSLPARVVASITEDRRSKFTATAHRYTTVDALNKKRVLLIRDSFADALIPFFQRTFSDIVDVHHTFHSHDVLMHLLRTFEPEIVYLIIVERDAIDQYLGFKKADQ